MGWAFLELGDFEAAAEALKQTDFVDAPLLRAIAYVHLDRMDDARAEVGRMLKVNPSITLAIWRQGYSFRDPAILDKFGADLSRAGLRQG